jgi:hypothetical protein
MRTDFTEWLRPRLQGKELLFITLTCSRRVGREELSEAIARLIHRIKRRVLGRKAEHKELTQIAVFEPTFKGGVHAHVILEDPYSLDVAKAFRSTQPIGKLITEEWAELGIGGKAVAQDVQRVYDLNGAIGYLHKRLRSASALDWIDLNNFCLPDRLAS